MTSHALESLPAFGLHVGPPAGRPKGPTPQNFTVSYPLFSLILSPYLKNSHGIGSIATLTNPSKLVAHPTPSRTYIWNVNSGNAAPSEYRITPLAAMADAPFKGP